MLGLVGLTVVAWVTVAPLELVVGGLTTGLGLASWIRVTGPVLWLRSSATVEPWTAWVATSGVTVALIVPWLMMLVSEPDLSTTA